MQIICDYLLASSIATGAATVIKTCGLVPFIAINRREAIEIVRVFVPLSESTNYSLLSETDGVNITVE